MLERFPEFYTTDAVHADVMNTKIVQPGNKIVEFLERPYSGDVIGFEWDASSTSPVLRRIDGGGRYITSLPSDYFDKHAIFDRHRCTRDRATGDITLSNGRGDGLVLDGTAGDVLVQKPKYYYRYECEYPYYRWWFSAEPHVGFSVWPAFMQRGDPLNPSTADYLYDGAYEAYGYLDGNTFKLGSASGKTPVTGGVGYPDLPNSGRLTIDDAETYGNNVTAGAGITNFWNYVGDQLLMYLEFGTFDIQSALGKGIVDLPNGVGFAGKLTGADNIDSRLAENGTGVGSGTNGQTPVTWRGIENPYGNVRKFIIGCNFKAGGIFRTIKRDGTGTLAATLAAGSYEEGTGASLTSGYVSALLEDELGGLAIMPSAAGGSDSTYLCDYWYPPAGSGDRILLAGGSWGKGRNAGPGSRYADSAVSHSNRYYGARVEFRPPGGA